MEGQPQPKDHQKSVKDTNDVSMIDLQEVQDKHHHLQDQEPKEKHTLLEELQRTQTSNSTSGSDEEVEEGLAGEGKKRKKKGLKDKIREKMSREDHQEDTANISSTENGGDQDKKGFLDKLIEKLPGGQHHHEKAGEDGGRIPAAEMTANDSAGGGGPGETHEKKGILEKIKEKLPGGHHEVKEKDN